MAETISVNLIGPGKVGKTLARLVAQVPGYRLQDVLGREQAAAEAACRFADSGRSVADFAQLRPADLWLLPVPDHRIAQIAQALADRAEMPPAVAIHCSGFHGASELRPLQDKGWSVASCHPSLSFADSGLACASFANSYCGIEGDKAAVSQGWRLMKAFGANPFMIRSEAKALYHAAAVFSNNFTTVLQAVAQEAWAEAGVPKEIAQEMHLALLETTLENFSSLGARAALTGPAARGDQAMLDQQGVVVDAWNPDAGSAYKALSRMAMCLKAEGKTSPG